VQDHKDDRRSLQREGLGVVVPTGYSFNLDGAATYLTMRDDDHAPSQKEEIAA
jgi:Na+/H+-dicarboxylate symporter